MGNGLRLVSLLIMARGAQVSRAARGLNNPFNRRACSELVEPACRAFSTLYDVAGATPSRCETVECHRMSQMSHDVTPHAAGTEFIRSSTTTSYGIQMRPMSPVFSPRASFWDIL